MRDHCLVRRVLSTALIGSLTFLSAAASAELPADGGPEVPVSDAARTDFQVGVALLQDPDGAKYEEAYKAFMKAYAESPSWKILGNLGLCALKLERFTDGVPAYERYLKHGAEDLAAEETDQIRRDLAVMKATSGIVTLQVSGGTNAMLTDTRLRAVQGPVINGYKVPPGGTLILRLTNGRHTFKAVSGELSAETSFSLDSGSEKTIELELKAPVMDREETTPAEPAVSNPAVQESSESPRTDTSLQTAGYVVGGIGVAALVGGGATMILGLGKKSALEEDCPQNSCRPRTDKEKKKFEDDRDELKLYGALSTAFLVGGGVLTATGVTLVVLGRNEPDETALLELTPVASPYFSGFFATGAF